MLFEIFQVQQQNELVKEIESCNTFTKDYGLSLTNEQALALIETRNQALKNHGRVEIGHGIIKDLIKAFYESPYISKENYIEALEELMEIFYAFKNETEDRIPDKELIQMMTDYFNGSCEGSIELLANRELEHFIRQMRGLEERENTGETEKGTHV